VLSLASYIQIRVWNSYGSSVHVKTWGKPQERTSFSLSRCAFVAMTLMISGVQRQRIDVECEA